LATLSSNFAFNFNNFSLLFSSFIVVLSSFLLLLLLSLSLLSSTFFSSFSPLLFSFSSSTIKNRTRKTGPNTLPFGKTNLQNDFCLPLIPSSFKGDCKTIDISHSSLTFKLGIVNDTPLIIGLKGLPSYF
jgi:hypothetical protein